MSLIALNLIDLWGGAIYIYMCIPSNNLPAPSISHLKLTLNLGQLPPDEDPGGEATSALVLWSLRLFHDPPLGHIQKMLSLPVLSPENFLLDLGTT